MFIYLYQHVYKNILSYSNTPYNNILLIFKGKAQNNSAKLPQFWNLTASKTKQVCETSMFELDKIKSKTILRDLLQFSK